MNQKAKTALAMVLPILGAAIWIPQLMGAGGEAKRLNTEEFPAEANLAFTPEPELEPEPATSEPAFDHALDGASKRESLEAPSADRGVVSEGEADRGESPSVRAMAAIERMEASRSSTGMADLVALWDEGDDAEEADRTDQKKSPALELFDDPGLDPLHAFLHENPLSAVLHGPSARVASLGSHLVREGDVLPGGLARVESIAARYLILSREEETLRIDLPPFQSRPRVTNTETASDDESTENEEPLRFERETAPAVSNVASPQAPSADGSEQ